MGAKRVVPLPVSAPFHCVDEAGRGAAGTELRALDVCDPRVPIVANVDAAVCAMPPQPSGARGAGRRRCAGKKSAAPCVEGVTTYVDVGPGTVLTGLVKKIHPEATIVNVGSPADLSALDAVLR
jgi:[acyl-carrier-protein] S-malonyltransferase